MVTHTPLKLLATDPEDLTVLSAMLQDSLVPMGEMTWQREQARFVLVANRFRWEGEPERDRKGTIHERVHTGLCVDHVRSVRRRGLDAKHPAKILELLAIRHQPLEGDGHVLDLAFSGGADIRIEVEKLAVRLDDIDEPWPTRRQPRHDAAERDE